MRANVNDMSYWWASEDPKDVVQRLSPNNEQTSIFGNTAMQQAVFRNILIYFSNVVKADSWDSGLNFTGNQGELVEMLVPMARSLTRQLVSIVTKQKLAFSVMAENDEQGVIQTVRLGNALVKQIIREQHLDVVYENMFEHSLLAGMGFLYTQWRTDKGEYYTTDENGLEHFKGDLEISAPAIWDVKFDSSIPNPDDWNWAEVRKIHNRWDLIAQFPDLEDELKKAVCVKDAQGRFSAMGEISPSDNDNIYVYAAYHKKTPSMPDGRMTVYVNDKCILTDGPNYYGDIPLYTCRAEPIPGCSYGYPYFSSLVPLQEMYDNSMSALATNNSTFGVQNVMVARGSNVSPTQIMGMNFLQYTPMEGGHGKPEPLNLTQSAPEAYKFIDLLKASLLDMSMINSALRGDPPTGVTSGAAIATLTTTALESVASSSKAARDTLRRCMLGAIECYKRFASVERELTDGMGDTAYSKTFQGSDLDGIRGIDIVELNPLMQTQLGREQLADKLMSTGAIKNVKGYFSILEGAPVSVLYENELSQEDLVNRENEALLTGEQVMVVNVDDHPYHIMQHSMLLNDPNVRMNAPRIQEIMNHILEHDKQARMIDPIFAAMVQTGKMPEQQMMAPPPGMPTGAAPSAPSGQGTGKEAKPANPAQDLLQRAGPKPSAQKEVA